MFDLNTFHATEPAYCAPAWCIGCKGLIVVSPDFFHCYKCNPVAFDWLAGMGHSEISPFTGDSVREPRNEVRTKGGRLPGGWLRMR